MERASAGKTEREIALTLTHVNEALDDLEQCNLAQSLINYAGISLYIDEARRANHLFPKELAAIVKASDLLNAVYLEAFAECGCKDPLD